MRNRTSALITGAIIFVLFARGTAQETPQAPLPDVQTLGPQVGTHVPNFTLLDQSGQSRTLKSLIGARGLMLVFFRSADW